VNIQSKNMNTTRANSSNQAQISNMLSPSKPSKDARQAREICFTSPIPPTRSSKEEGRKRSQNEQFISPPNRKSHTTQKNTNKRRKRNDSLQSDIKSKVFPSEASENGNSSCVISNNENLKTDNVMINKILEIIGPDEDRIGFAVNLKWDVSELIIEFLNENYSNLLQNPDDNEECQFHLKLDNELIESSTTVSELNFESSSSYRIELSSRSIDSKVRGESLAAFLF